MKNLKSLGKSLNNEEQKAILGGTRVPGGSCTDSNIDCFLIGNNACPRGQGCFLSDDDNNPSAYCRCL